MCAYLKISVFVFEKICSNFYFFKNNNINIFKLKKFFFYFLKKDLNVNTNKNNYINEFAI